MPDELKLVILTRLSYELVLHKYLFEDDPFDLLVVAVLGEPAFTYERVLFARTPTCRRDLDTVEKPVRTEQSAVVMPYFDLNK
jgi:hypothetical protein